MKADDEAPTVTLGDNPASKSPFTKVYEKAVEKFKLASPIELKKNLCNGKVSIQRGEFGTDKPKIIFKIIFRNSIGKTLYNAVISHRVSKLKRVEEKVHKNQVKIATYNAEAAKKLQYCLINF